MTKGKNAIEYIFWLSELKPTIQETPENHDNGPKSGGAVHLDHVRFSYPLRPGNGNTLPLSARELGPVGACRGGDSLGERRDKVPCVGGAEG